MQPTECALNIITNLSTGPRKKRGHISAYAWKLLHANFILLYAIKNIKIKNTAQCTRIYKQYTGQSKIGQTVPFYTNFCPNFSEYFEFTS